jgi:hypothetical protein
MFTANANAATQEKVPPAPVLCSSINTFGDQLLVNVNNAVGKQISIESISPEKQAELASVLQQKRQIWDDDRNKQYSALLSKAANDKQSAAIEQFKASLDSAIITRRGSIDSAINAYYRDYNAKVESQNMQINNARIQIKNTTIDAINSAKKDCNDQKEPKAIRLSIQTNLNNSKGILQNSRNGLRGFTQDLSDIREQEVKDIDKAMADFKLSLSAAIQTLKDNLSSSGADYKQFGL